MRQERQKLEKIIATGKIPNSITQLYKEYFKGGNISNRNGLIYLMDIPDTISNTLPSNAKRWCASSETLFTDFNRWLWNFGLNAPDLEGTWKREGTTPGKLWSILENTFSQEIVGTNPKTTHQDKVHINTCLLQHSKELETQGYFDPKNNTDARTRIEASIVQRYGQPRFREQLLEAYGNRCAITECDVIFALEAAHILPYKGEHTNDVRNRLVLTE